MSRFLSQIGTIFAVTVATAATLGGLPRPASAADSGDRASSRANFDSANPQPATAYPGPESLPLSIPVRSAAQLRADLRQSQSINDSLNLDLTDTIVLSRLVAIDDMLEKISDHYGTDYLWSLAMMMAESNLDPSAQGPLVDDRGLGQIGYVIESVARLWGPDLTSPYYSAQFDPQASIWEPNTNMTAEAIWFRNILTFPYVTAMDQTYAIYTKGIYSVDPATGAISERAQVDVRRAHSHIAQLQKLLYLKDYVRQQGDVVSVRYPLAGAILEIDRTATDGIGSYSALRDLFIDAGANGTGEAVAEYSYFHEAISYTDLLDRGYNVDPTVALRQIKTAMDSRAAFIRGDGSVAGAFARDYAKVVNRLAG